VPTISSDIWIILSFLAGGVVVGLVMRIIQLARMNEVAGSQAALEERVHRREEELVEVNTTIKEERVRNASLNGEVSSLRAQLEAERNIVSEKIGAVEKAKTDIKNAFDALAAQALLTNNKVFLDLAKGELAKTQLSATADLDKRQQAIDGLIKPVRESLEKFDTYVREVEKERVGTYASLNQYLVSLDQTQKQLQSETANLVKALRQPGARGRWGELQLKRVVELAGMIDHVDFFPQQTASTESGPLRPDLIVKLPAGKNIIVDSKCPLSAYLEALDCTDEATRRTKFADHARQIRNHLTTLGRKGYWEQFDPSPEFVVMFLPGENFFGAALEVDPSLIEFGVDNHVILSTPTTLIALLKAVYYGWRQETMALNARNISELGQALYERLSSLGDHFKRLGKGLGQAVESYNNAIGSLERTVLVSARRFRALGSASGSRQIEELIPIDHVPRALQAPEFNVGEGEKVDATFLTPENEVLPISEDPPTDF
jgi:DNA recombination protein RmuC